MNDVVQQIKAQVAALYDEGLAILLAEVEGSEKPKKAKADDRKKKPLPTVMTYQSWYTKALPVVKQLIPERYGEFQDQYKLDRRKESEISFLTYTISDYLIGLRVTKGWAKEPVVDPLNAFAAKFHHQLTIVRSAQERVDSVLSDIRGVLQAELFDNELDAAQDLQKKGHLRAAGALAGVTLESHLSAIAANHSVRMTKKNPTISDWNDTLKKADVYDVPDWRFIQRLGDIRNLCVHAKEREPTREEVDELTEGVRKVTKTLF